MAEVFAGFLSYTDAQIGRVLDYLEESGQLDNTIIVVISDNGASGEGGPNGSVNEVKFFNGYIDTVEESMRYIDHLGGPETYPHYAIGWAMAFNTPYKLYKRYASHEGGIADTAIISWPNGIKAHGEVRDNYVNVCDITPTIYDLLGVTPPAEVGGITQKPLDGVSFRAALDNPSADTGKDTQFYAMLGTRGIWHEGWFANTVHAATPAGWSHFDKDRWELFHIEADRSQCHDLAAEQPDKLEELKKLWFDEAAKYNGLPLADLNILETMTRWRPYLVGERKSFTYYPDAAEVGMGAAAEPRGQSLVRAGRGDDRHDRGRGRAVQTGRGTRRPCAVHSGRAPALRLQLHGRGGADGVIARSDSAGPSHLRSQLHPNGHSREQPHTARRCHAVHRRRRRRVAAERQGPSGNVRACRRYHQRRAQHRVGGVAVRSRLRTRSPAAPSRRSTSTSPGRRTSTSEKELALAFSKD